MKIRNVLFCCVLFVSDILLISCNDAKYAGHEFNGAYMGENISRIAFPMGGMGAGMVCIEGNGCISHVSVKHKPEVFNEPYMFGAISIKDLANGAKVLEGPVQDWKKFGCPGTGNGAIETTYGFPRFEKVEFLARFPFATVKLADDDIPLKVSIKGWSPFIPGDAYNSSLPVAALEYTFTNNSAKEQDIVFSYNASNFMKTKGWNIDNFNKKDNRIIPLKNGYILWQDPTKSKLSKEDENYAEQGGFAIFTDEPDVIVDPCWFRGAWFDSRTVLWKDIEACKTPSSEPDHGAPGASLFVPFKLKKGEVKTIKLMFSWHVPYSDFRSGEGPCDCKENTLKGKKCCSVSVSRYYEPWYAGQFKDISTLINYWQMNYDELRDKTMLFTETFYDSDLPDVVLEAIAANLTILKSPTVLRQKDGRLWAFEGSSDNLGCCPGSCTHVWNYAQAISRLFPSLERTFRETEFKVSQDSSGHQTFRSALPIRPTFHNFHAAADGQLGGIMKAYREWRISGDNMWLEKMWPEVKQSFQYCRETWDPRRKGILEEPQHNTYDIEFWGPNGMLTSFYLGAAQAMILMGQALDKDVSEYENLLKKGKKYMETELWNGEYFIQQIKWEGLETPKPTAETKGWRVNYSDEALKVLREEGPKYQYGNGCLSDGVLGCWIASMCGLDDFIDREKLRSHLNAVYKYNFKTSLVDHVNPQRPSFALGREGGLLLCTWPKGNNLTLPFVYSNEVWTGIEYQVAAHLMELGEVENGLEILRHARKRYDGKIRNPFNEYECGHWYARAMASYGMIQGLTGTFFDAVDRVMYIDSKIGEDFRCFFACETGFGHVGLKNGKPFTDVKYGSIPVSKYILAKK